MDCWEDIPSIPCKIFMAAPFDSYSWAYSDLAIPQPKEFSNVEYVHLTEEMFYPNKPGFSRDITQGCYWGSTIMYNIGIQVAAYMGVKEIYLIGVDMTYTGPVLSGGNHFFEDYISDKSLINKINRQTDLDLERARMMKAYEKAEEYSRKHGFRIYNATRGGNLEVFERVCFDSLF